MSEITTPTPRSKKRSPVWFFLILAVLSLGAIGAISAYVLSQQLTEEQFNTAFELWKQKGPKSYEMRYTVRRGGEKPDNYYVRVKDGVVVFVTLNDLMLTTDLFKYRSMTALMEDVHRFLEIDGEPDRPWTYNWARFDPTDGHLRSFARGMKWSNERLLIDVKEFQAQ